MHVSNLFYNDAERAAGGAAGRALARRHRVLLQLRRGGQRGGDQARAQARARAATSSSSHGAFHGRTYGALSATPQESKQAPFAPLVPGLPRGRRRRTIADAVDARHRRRAARADPGRVGREPAVDDVAAGRTARRATRPARRWSSTRSRPGWGGPASLWAYEQLRRRAGRDDAGQGARRRAADRRAGDRAARCADVFAPGRPRLDVRRRPGGLAPPRTRRST